MANVVSRPEAGQAVFIGVDVSRTKWVINVRWGGAERRRLSTAPELRHLATLVATTFVGTLLWLAAKAGSNPQAAWDQLVTFLQGL